MSLVRFSRPPFSPWKEISPFGDLDSLSNRISQVFGEPLGNFAGGNDSWVPAVSIEEGADTLTLTAEIPGMKEEDIDVEVENNVLTIRGEKREEREEKDEERRFHLWERRFGSFQRSFTLPSTVDAGGINATYEKGVLRVLMPKVSEAKGRKIRVGSEK